MKTIPTIPTVEINHVEAGRLIRSEREMAGVKMRALATEMKISAPYLHDLEMGKRNWSEEYFKSAQAGIAKLSGKEVRP